MEQLLSFDEQACLFCRSSLSFRLSRFGCVFTCKCGTSTLDGQKVVRKFYDQLRNRGTNLGLLPFLPRVDLATFATDDVLQAKLVSVEMECESKKALVFTENLSSTEQETLLSSLSHALVEQHQTWHHEGVNRQTAQRLSALAFSLGAVDALLFELAGLADSPGENFMLSSPPPQLTDLLRSESSHEEGGQSDTMDRIPSVLRQTLREHQFVAVQQAIRWHGRALIADEMGVGKTLEALATVAALEAYPLLIVAPSALKYMWAEEVEKYLYAQVGIHDIHLIHGANDALSADPAETPAVVITSFHMAAALSAQLRARTWKCLLVDESHTLHTNTSGHDARYTKLLIDIGKVAKHCLLLSGTPALTSPFDMFNQLDTLRPGLLGETRWHFALRYCHLRMAPYLDVLECIRPVEFTSALRSLYMIRRLKGDVLELPAKTRIILKVTASAEQAAALRENAPLPHNASDLFQRRYSKCWRLKQRGIFEAVSYVCDKYTSVVLFAHHIALMDTLAGHLASRSISFIRVDGGVDVQVRGKLIEKFSRGEVQVALMGITACAVGVSLTTAQCAVFCELPPDASWMAQAEDRLHRFGQEHEVSVYYLIGIHLSFDMQHFSELSQGFTRVRAVTDRVPASFELSHVSHTHHALPMKGQLSKKEVEGPLRSPSVPAAQDATFFFAISQNTQRIHVKSSYSDSRTAVSTGQTSFYRSFAPEEAIACVRDRSQPVWEQLSEFLDRVAQLSSFHQRRLLQMGQWLPCTFVWPLSSHDCGSSAVACTISGKRDRYKHSSRPPVRQAQADGGRHKEMLQREGVGWGFWWKVSRAGLPVRFYFSRMRWLNSCNASHPNGVFQPRCLCCQRALPHLVAATVRPDSPSAPLRPGAVIEASADVVMFCQGRCRETFFLQRSGSAIRRSLLRADRGVCSNCRVNCEKLSMECQATKSIKGREKLVCRELPHLKGFPALFQAFVRNPIQGNLWHADHVVPVALGGGEATLANLQTLCVACHALKTQEDVKAIQSDRRKLIAQQHTPEREERAQWATTTWDIAEAKLLRKEQAHRATRRLR